jgi:hypothetical protein
MLYNYVSLVLYAIYSGREITVIWWSSTAKVEAVGSSKIFVLVCKAQKVSGSNFD